MRDSASIPRRLNRGAVRQIDRGIVHRRNRAETPEMTLVWNSADQDLSDNVSKIKLDPVHATPDSRGNPSSEGLSEKSQVSSEIVSFFYTVPDEHLRDGNSLEFVAAGDARVAGWTARNSDVNVALRSHRIRTLNFIWTK